MSKRAKLYVLTLRVRPAGVRAGFPFSNAERLMLRALAAHYNDPIACAYGSVGYFARQCGWSSDAYGRSVIASLEEAGIVQRMFYGRGRDDSRTTNLYDFPLMRYAAELPMSSEAKLELEARRTAFFRDGRKPMPLQMQLKSCGLEAVPPPDSEAVPPPDSEAGVEVKSEGKRLISHPYGFPTAAAAVERSQKALGMRNAKATARAKTKATTPERQDAAGNPREAGGASESSGARPWEIRKRKKHSLQPESAARDGEDAAWNQTLRWALDEMSITDERMAGHLRRVLELRMEQWPLSMMDAARLAVKAWMDYHDPSVRRAFYPSPKMFFRDGLWLRRDAWQLDREWMRDFRELRGARVGTGAGPSRPN